MAVESHRASSNRRFMKLKEAQPKEKNPSAVQPHFFCKPTISSSKKKLFICGNFQGLGCSTPSPVSHPTLPPSSGCSDKKSEKKKKEKQKSSNSNVFCSPVIPFGADADGLVSQISTLSSRRSNAARNYSESSVARRILYQGASSPDFIPKFETRRYSNVRGSRPSHAALAEMMFDCELQWECHNFFDCYGDWRLDVDNMSYEELLELGDRIGHVSTGLKEEEILHCIRKIKPFSSLQPSLYIHGNVDRKCSICQEEYEKNDEVGKLKCGHAYHLCCVREWLAQKNSCPVCKAPASKF